MKILLTILGVCYALSPYDLIPDFFIGLGWLDDLAILFLLWKFFYAPMGKRYRYANAYQRYRQAFQKGKGNRTAADEPAGSGPHFNEKESEKDPWMILGVPRDAPQEQIKRAYKGLAMRYHPDKVMHLGEEFKVLADKRFKEIQRAYMELKTK